MSIVARISSEPLDQTSDLLGLMVKLLQTLVSLIDREECEVVSDFNVGFEFSTRPKRDIRTSGPTRYASRTAVG